MKKYNWPATRQQIEVCCDLPTLQRWDEEFEKQLVLIEVEYGSLDNVPDNLRGMVHANVCNQKQCKYRISLIQNPVSSAGVLKMFHNVCKELYPDEYETIVKTSLNRLGRSGTPWEELIKHRKQ